MDAPADFRDPGARIAWADGASLVALSMLLVGTVWVVPYLPTNDGPEWIFASHAENHYADPGAPYRDALTPALQFASRGFGTIYAPIEAWLGWERGLQVTLSLVLLAAAWGFVALVRSLQPTRAALAFLGFPLALSWPFYIGLWPFVVSSAIGLFILALAVRWDDLTLRRMSALATLLFVQGVAHVFGAVLAGGAIAFLYVGRAPRGERLATFGRVLLTGVPAASILLACVICSRDLSSAPLVRHFMWFPFWDVLRMLPSILVPGPFARALAATLILLVAAAVVARRTLRFDTAKADRALGAAGLLLLGTSTLAPYEIPGWQAFSPRFVPLGVALTLAVVPLERLGHAARRSVSGLLFVISVVSLIVSYPFHERLVRLCPDAIEGLRSLGQADGQLLSFVFRATEQSSYDAVRSEVPFLVPLRHMGSLYATVMGAVPATSFTGDPAIHPFMRRPSTRPLPNSAALWGTLTSYAFSHDIAYRNAAEEPLATAGMFYEHVALFGGIPSDFALWRARGFELDLKSTTTLVAHFEPCSVELALPSRLAEQTTGVDVLAGPAQVLATDHAAFTLRDGLSRMTVAPAPCGEVTVHLHVDPRIVTGACRNASPQGDLRADITRSSNVIACDEP